MRTLGSISLVCTVALLGALPAARAQTLASTLIISGGATDATNLNGGSGGPNVNRLGFLSDLHYDRVNNVYYGLADRGPGGGTIAYETRVQQFTVDVDSVTGAASNFQIQQTIRFRDANGAAFNGLNPLLLSGNSGNLGLSFDPEGFVVLPNGNFLVADEYGPSVYEFARFDNAGTPEARFLRAFNAPNNLLPREADTDLNFVDGRPTITTGRQDNRGYEGLTVTPDGTRAFAVLQDPLVNEGDGNDGRRSRNLRIVRYDVATGVSDGQFLYQLDSIASLNDDTFDFGATNQGRNIGLSSITAINDSEFFVLERDNRGIGVENPVNTNNALSDVESKRIYRINLSGATDVTNISLAGTNALPGGVTAVGKSLYFDMAAALTAGGQLIPEKMEGFAVGPQLANGNYALLIGTDNDFSVTQNSSGTQLNVLYQVNPADPGADSLQTALNDPIPEGYALLPTYLYSLNGAVTGFVAPVVVPESGAGVLMSLAGVGLLGGRVLLRRRKN